VTYPARLRSGFFWTASIGKSYATLNCAAVVEVTAALLKMLKQSAPSRLINASSQAARTASALHARMRRLQGILAALQPRVGCRVGPGARFDPDPRAGAHGNRL